MLKSPLVLWITGGEILHPAFYSYLPSGLLFLCGRERASALPLHLPQNVPWLCVSVRGCGIERNRECVPVCEQESSNVLVDRLDLCACPCGRMCVCLVHMQASLHKLFLQRGLCLCSPHIRLMAYRSCNTFFSFNTISKPHHSPPDFLNVLFSHSSTVEKSGGHYRTVMLF